MSILNAFSLRGRAQNCLWSYSTLTKQTIILRKLRGRKLPLGYTNSFSIHRPNIKFLKRVKSKKTYCSSLVLILSLCFSKVSFSIPDHVAVDLKHMQWQNSVIYPRCIHNFSCSFSDATKLLSSEMWQLCMHCAIMLNLFTSYMKTDNCIRIASFD